MWIFYVLTHIFGSFKSCPELGTCGSVWIVGTSLWTRGEGGGAMLGREHSTIDRTIL